MKKNAHLGYGQFLRLDLVGTTSRPGQKPQVPVMTLLSRLFQQVDTPHLERNYFLKIVLALSSLFLLRKHQ